MGWRRYVWSLPSLPVPVRFVLARLWRRVPGPDDIGRAIESRLRPSPRAELRLLVANVAWFALLMLGASRLRGGA